MPTTSLPLSTSASASPPGAPIPAADYIPLVSRLVEFLRERRFAAGERLPPERFLAAHLGVSRNALREAIATLSALRVVESRANSGIYLKDLAAESSFETIVMLSELGKNPSAQEVVDMMEVRQTLELDAVRLACRRRSEADLAAMNRILQQTDELLDSGGNIADLDQAFHRLLASSSQNGVLVRMLHAFYRLSLARRRVYFANVEAGRASAAEHRALTLAIAQRDEVAGQQLMNNHLGDAMRYWSEVFGVVAQPGSQASPDGA